MSSVGHGHKKRCSKARIFEAPSDAARLILVGVSTCSAVHTFS
jgi:hypothetical protein